MSMIKWIGSLREPTHSVTLKVFSYDGNGNLIERSDRNDDIITYQYDALNRLTAKLYPDDTSESYTYDANGEYVICIQELRIPLLSYTYDHGADQSCQCFYHREFFPSQM